jgi:hypothetical protein
MELDEISLQLLQTTRLKRSVDIVALPRLVGAAGEAELVELVDRGVLIESNGRIALGDGAEELRRAAIARERETRNPAALAATYLRFERCDAELKQIVVAWQLRLDRDGTPPNDHTDPEYDGAVIDRLGALHDDLAPVLEEIVALVPRLAGYARRLEEALARVRAGETTYLSSPLLDSYHTVWFELHEELFDAQGLDRRAREAETN